MSDYNYYQNKRSFSGNFDQDEQNLSDYNYYQKRQSFSGNFDQDEQNFHGNFDQNRPGFSGNFVQNRQNTYGSFSQDRQNFSGSFVKNRLNYSRSFAKNENTSRNPVKNRNKLPGNFGQKSQKFGRKYTPVERHYSDDRPIGPNKFNRKKESRFGKEKMERKKKPKKSTEEVMLLNKKWEKEYMLDFFKSDDDICSRLMLIDCIENRRMIYPISSIIDQSFESSTAEGKIKYSIIPDKPAVAEVIVDDNVIASASAFNRKALAEEIASIKALRQFMKKCFTVKIDQAVGSEPITKEEILSRDESAQKYIKMSGMVDRKKPQFEDHLEQKAYKHERNQNKHTVEKVLLKNIEEMIKEFAEDPNPEWEDITFTNEYSRRQRELIQEFAHKHGLQALSLSQGFQYYKNQYYIVVSKPVFTKEVLTSLIEAGGKTDKYQVFPPGESSLQFLRELSNVHDTTGDGEEVGEGEEEEGEEEMAG